MKEFEDAEPTTTTWNIPVVIGRNIFKKRGDLAKYISWIICGIAGIYSIVYYIIIGLFEENPKLSSFCVSVLGLFSIVFGILVGRLCLVVEELRHVKTRYEGQYCKMIRACFSGIKKGPVVFLIAALAIVFFIISRLTGLDWKQLRYLAYFLSGIGVGPLVVHLFSLDTQSEVDISTILEKTGNCIAYGLAWSYYYNYLENALQNFETQVKKTINKKPTLSSDKLILLIPHNCFAVEKKLDEIDRANISLIKGYFDDDEFSVYKLKINSRDHKYYAMQFVKDPLITLRKMSASDDETINKNDLENEVKLFYKKLSEILTDSTNPVGACLLVPYEIPKERVGNNGELVRCITYIVDKFPEVQPGGFVELDRQNKKKKRKNKKNKSECGKPLI